MPMGRLAPATQVYMASGEATEQAQLPEKFKTTPVATSPLSSGQQFPPSWITNVHTSPVVCRVPRMGGIRHLYARGAQRQPYERLGTPGGNPMRPWISSYQPNDMGPIRDAGFYDKLFQGGYPGFNLGLSFKVQTLPSMGAVSGMNRRGPGNRNQSEAVNKVRRPTGRPSVR